MTCINVIIPDDHLAKLEAEAEAEERTLSFVVRRAIKLYVERDKK